MEMRQFNLALLILLTATSAYAAAPTRTYNYVAHTTIDPTQNNTNENSLYSYLQAGVDTYASGSLTNDAVSSSAAIAYSKLNLLGSITNNDISASAGIVGSKLDLSSPGIIGGTSPAAGTFTTLVGTTLNVSGQVNLGSTHQGDIFYDNGSSVVRLTPGTNGQFLKTQGNGANPTWGTPADINTGNVVFSWSVGGNGSASSATTGHGLSNNATIAGNNITNVGGAYYVGTSYNAGTSPLTAFGTKFKKIAGISTLTLYARGSLESGTGTAQMAIHVSSLTSSYANLGGAGAYDWGSTTLDVSSLTNDTVYDMDFLLRDSKSATPTAQAYDSIIVFGS